MLIIAVVVHVLAGTLYVSMGAVEYIMIRMKQARYRRLLRALHRMLLLLLGIIYILLALSHMPGDEASEAGAETQTETAVTK